MSGFKSISMTAYRRPEYEAQVLASLGEPHLKGYRFFPHHDTGTGRFGTLGCDGNTFKALSASFDFGSDFNLHLEDDTVVSPDSLDLCDWFYSHPERDNYAALCLHSHSRDLNNPLDIVEDARIAWGWACTREVWYKYFLPEWGNKRRVDPKGWDWSIHLTIQRHGLKVLRPVLSRVLNIGRDNGTYEYPRHWDSWAKDLVHSPGGLAEEGETFRITSRIETMPPMDDWAIEELELEAKESKTLCSDCPPFSYPTNKTRCLECPVRKL